jgi:AraC family transcriptional regulator of adaptative response/methylated-DNA-[protein]-cysteine methyltransferase
MAFSSEYDTVARAIRFLHRNFKRQPSLEEVARHVGLSQFHFQRLFSRWAGVSPKRFLQYLTVEYAKTRLRESSPVLHAAFDAGLSGPARLHDLLLTTEGVTPGQFKAMGETLAISHGFADTPFGPALLANTPRGLCHLAFLEANDLEGSTAVSDLADAWPEATILHDPDGAKALAGTIFSRVPHGGGPQTLPLLLRGTNFQIRVWTALLRIGSGHLTSYGRLAKLLGHPGASRAIGTALGRNPVAYLIPCHRVIRESGLPGGYRWGPERKEAILGWEAARLVS